MNKNDDIINYSYNGMQRQELENRLFFEKGIRQLIDLDVLQDIQNKLARVTGLAMVTVDLQGQPLTKETSFCEYCISRRRDEIGKKSCFFSDAYGGLRASITNEPYVYHCPAGLTDCAIPIIFNGQYMGTIVIGQVRTLSSEKIDSVKSVISIDSTYNDNPKMLELYDRVPIMELHKLKMTGDLILFLVKEMLEKQLLKLIQQEYESVNQQLRYENFVKEVELEKLKQVEKNKLSSELKPQLMMSILNSVNNVSMIEGADMTNELICLFAETIRYSFQKNTEFVSLESELENIKRYLQIQQICSDNTFDFDIEQRCSITEKKILSLVLLPFVENALTHGILLLTDKRGKIKITVSETPIDYLVAISDNGVGLSFETVEQLTDEQVLTYEKDREYNGLSILNTRKRLVRHYGKEFDIVMQSNKGQGLTVVVRIPIEE